MQQDSSSSRQLSIYEDIKRNLSSGAFGERLPSLRQLAIKYNSSFGTVRQSMVKLQFEGYIRAEHGKGYLVLPRGQKQKQIIIIERTGDEHLFSKFLNNFQKYFAGYPNISISCEDPRLMKGERAQSVLKRICENSNEIEAVFFDTQTYENNFAENELASIMSKTKLFHYFYTGGVSKKLNIPGVSTSWYHGGYIGTRHLIEVGCRNILIIAHVEFDFTEGCKHAVSDSLFRHDLNLEVNNGSDPASLKKLISGNRFDAVYAYGDARLLPVMTVLRDLNLRIPTDIALLGYYNTPWVTEIAGVPMSSVSIKEDKMINEICDMSMGKSVQFQTIIKPKLVLRESTLGFRK